MDIGLVNQNSVKVRNVLSSCMGKYSVVAFLNQMLHIIMFYYGQRLLQGATFLLKFFNVCIVEDCTIPADI